MISTMTTRFTADTEFLGALFDELFPIGRSISGPGLRKTLGIFARYMPLEIERLESGQQVFDWVLPPEWTLRGATLRGPGGDTIADAARSSLEVVNYSEGVDRKLNLAELLPHLHSIPRLPDAIPYVTSYYKRSWGFCLPDRVLETLPKGEYHAHIDADLEPGGLEFGHCVIDGESGAEILLSSYVCHPSLANNELSGPLVLLGLFDRIRRWPRRRFSYRFLLNPETIGSLCFLDRYGDHLRQTLEAGLVLTCLGGPVPHLSYKLSRRGTSLLDRVILQTPRERVALRSFDPRSGSDERQFCSPGFNLPVGQIARTVYGEYDGYHNSLDDKAFMGIKPLVASIDEIERLLLQVEIAGTFRNLSPFGEPQLGRRDLYPNTNSDKTRNHSADSVLDSRVFLGRVLMILNYGDGEHDMLDIARRCECSLDDLREVIERLEALGLLVHDHGRARTP